jgi:hypothetical protein
MARAVTFCPAKRDLIAQTGPHLAFFVKCGTIGSTFCTNVVISEQNNGFDKQRKNN